MILIDDFNWRLIDKINKDKFFYFKSMLIHSDILFYSKTLSPQKNYSLIIIYLYKINKVLFQTKNQSLLYLKYYFFSE
jgi:hypothetical protein